MTFIAEVGAGMVKAAVTAVPAALPAVTAAVPEIAATTVATGVRALAEPVTAAVPTSVEAVAPVFEAAGPITQALPAPEAVTETLAGGAEALTKPLVPPATPETIFDALPAHTGLEMVAQGFMEGKLDLPGTDLLPEELAKSPQFQALAYVAHHAGIPEDAIQNPVFLEQLAKQLDGVKEAMKDVPQEERFAFFTKQMQRALSDTMKRYDEKELEKLKEKAELEAIKRRMNEYRKSIVQDNRMLPHAKAVALERVSNLEQALVLDARLRLTFGRNILTMLIGDALISSAKA